MAKPMHCLPWSPESVALMIKLRDVDRLGWSVIAPIFGRSTTSCASRYHAERERKVRDADPLIPHPITREVDKIITAADITARMDERDQRYAAAFHRDITAIMCGDPPPGYSALDRQRISEQAIGV